MTLGGAAGGVGCVVEDVSVRIEERRFFVIASQMELFDWRSRVLAAVIVRPVTSATIWMSVAGNGITDLSSAALVARVAVVTAGGGGIRIWRDGVMERPRRAEELGRGTRNGEPYLFSGLCGYRS